MYKLRFSKSVKKDFKRIPKSIQKYILKKIDLLILNPFPQNSKKLQTTDYYRIRVGDYGIVYSVYNEILTIEIIRIRHRKDVYRSL